MHILTFIIVLLFPFVTIISKLAPASTIPVYFRSDVAAFISSELGSLTFYWMGYLWNQVGESINEQKYFWTVGAVFIFFIVSKIIHTLPYFWFYAFVALGLGILANPKGSTRGRFSTKVIAIISFVLCGYYTFILVGMAWFDFRPSSYYVYPYVIKEYIDIFLNSLIAN